MLIIKRNSKAKLKDYYEAITDFNKAIELKPDFANAYFLRGNSKKKLGMSFSDDYNKAIELNPNYLDAYFNRGSLKDSLKDYYGAIADFTKVLELKPDFANTYFLRGNSKAKLKDFNGAIDDFNKAIELKPDYADAYYYRGNSKKELGKLYCSDYDKSCQLGKQMSCEQYKITCRNLEL